MSDKEIHQNLSKKRPQKNCRGGFGVYCCISGCQSAFYDTNRVKTGIDFLNCQKIQYCVTNSCKLLKDIGVLEELINLVKRKKSWFVNFILTQSKFEYL